MRVEVAAAFVGYARVREKEREQVAIDRSRADEPDRRQPQALLVDLACQWHRARAHAADVGVMRAIGDEREQPPAAVVNGRHHGHVREVGPAGVRVVQSDDIAGRESMGGDRGAHGKRRRPEMHRNVGRMRHESRTRIEYGARIIVTLFDVR